MTITYPRPHTSALTDAAVNCSATSVALAERDMMTEARSVYVRRCQLFEAVEFARRDAMGRGAC